MNNIPYEYHNIPIPGGGYVTGLAYHNEVREVLYCRTDIGGVYRFEYANKTWKSLGDHIRTDMLDESYPIAIALDDQNPGRLYIACGRFESEEGVLCISEDRGNHFEYRSIPVPVHGNLYGRGTGYRLIVSHRDPNTLYFASQTSGLLVTHDRGESWLRTDINGEMFLTFVFETPDERCLVVGTAGVLTRDRNGVRGHSLYVSYDKGESFAPLPQPECPILRESTMPGYVAQRYAYDGQNLYVTFAQTGRANDNPIMSYSCDCGDVVGGIVVRYDFLRNGRISACSEITPNASNTLKMAKDLASLRDDRLFPVANINGDVGATNARKNAVYDFAFSGISTCKAMPGLLVVSTICRKQGDKLYISTDYGDHWAVILCGTYLGTLTTRAPYLNPEYYDGASTVHWVSDIKINPFDPEELWFNSGTGLFHCDNFQDNKRIFSDYSDGIEETVHLNLYSPVHGGVKLIDMVGDIGGLAFTGISATADKPFMDENNHKQVTCINADYSDALPGNVIISARGNWTGTSKGGLLLSRDLCRSFKKIGMPYGINAYIDSLLNRIEQPNVDPGWVAMGQDTRNIVWGLCDNTELTFNGIIVSHNGGYTFEKAKVCDTHGFTIEQGHMRVYSDKIDPDLFFGFADRGRIFVSTDGGATFIKKNTTASFSQNLDFGLLGAGERFEIRGENGKRGVFYIAAGNHGLWKMHYDYDRKEVLLDKLTHERDCIYCIGLGIQNGSKNILTDNKVLYFNGTIDGEYGFYRSADDMKTVERINTPSQMYGDIRTIDGDKKVYGRFYIGTGTRGLLYGMPQRSMNASFDLI
ncbi:MAG: endoglucanase [Lachnospiraceae bacterium]|nr:endoglucanase [Candidatus Merdinaster equi]